MTMQGLGHSIREQFPILAQSVRGNPLIYLDSAATTQKPSCVIEAEKRVYEHSYANIHRGLYDLSERATEQFEFARADVASFINADKREIIFTRNATESINNVARFARTFLQEGDIILLTAMEHHSNIVPWQEAARETGAKLVFVELTTDGRLDMEDFSKKISSRVRMVSVTSMSNVLGTINPVSDIITQAHDVGALVLVDAAQSAGRVSIDVKEWDADFVAFSGHKMYGPSGVGVLYGKQQHLERMHPALFGGDMVANVSRERAVWNDIPWRFEAGTPDIAGVIALGEAVRFLQNIGIDAVRDHEQEMIRLLLSRLQGVTVLGPSAQYRGGVVSWTIDGIHSHDLASLLDEKGIAIRAGHHCAQPLLETLGISECARASVSVFTTPEDINALGDVIEQSIQLLGNSKGNAI